MIAARSALLDYYSDKAAAFGGFFLASLFGLITMLAIVQGMNFKNPLDGVWMGTIFLLTCAFVFLRFYRDMKHFRVDFSVTLVWVLVFLLLINGIINQQIYFEDILIGLSFIPVLTFAYVGYYVIQQFAYYANLASKMVHGTFSQEIGGLHYVAGHDKMNIDECKHGKTRIMSLNKHIHIYDKIQKTRLGKVIIIKGFEYPYWFLMLILVIITYGTIYM